MVFHCGNISKLLVAMLVASAGILPGCGENDFQSESDFLDSVRDSEAPLDPAGGTLPPVGDSMEDVARIRVETNELDAGTIANDKLHHTTLKVYNDGKMPLKLTRVDTTCACTQGHISPENAVVPPGGESTIDIVIDPYRIPGFHSRKVLTITSTDPNRGTVEVGVTAAVEPEFEIESDEIALGDIKKGESLEKRIRFRQLQEKPIALGEIEPLTTGATTPKIPGVSGRAVEVPESEWKTPGKREYEIVLQIGPDLPAGPFERNVLLHMDLERWKRHRIQITGNVLAPYRVLPQYPLRGLLKSNATADALEANFSVTADSPVTLSELSAEQPELQLAATAGATPNEAGIKVTLPGGVPAGPLDEVVRFKVQVGDRTFDEFVGVRTLPGAAAGGHDHGLGEGHSPGDGHNH